MEDYSKDLLGTFVRSAGATIGAKIAGGGPGSIIAAGRGADKLSKKFKKTTSKVRGY